MNGGPVCGGCGEDINLGPPYIKIHGVRYHVTCSPGSVGDLARQVEAERSQELADKIDEAPFSKEERGEVFSYEEGASI